MVIDSMARTAKHYYLAPHNDDDRIIILLYSSHLQKTSMRILAYLLHDRQQESNRKHCMAYSIEHYCREQCNRSGPASVWRVYAYLWAHEGHVDGSEQAIQRGTGLSTSAVNDAIYTLWERGVLDLED